MEIFCKKDIIPPSEVHVQSILSNSLQIADILEAVIADVGPSSIWQSSFSVSEEYLRRLQVFRQENLISRASVILDHKASRKIVKLWPFISGVFDSAFMAENHSKMMLIRSDAGHRISVISSQNLTRGNRYESSVIISLPEIFDSLMQDFNKIANLHSIPLNELFGRSSQEH